MSCFKTCLKHFRGWTLIKENNKKLNVEDDSVSVSCEYWTFFSSVQLHQPPDLFCQHFIFWLLSGYWEILYTYNTKCFWTEFRKTSKILRLFRCYQHVYYWQDIYNLLFNITYQVYFSCFRVWAKKLKEDEDNIIIMLNRLLTVEPNSIRKIQYLVSSAGHRLTLRHISKNKKCH